MNLPPPPLLSFALYQRPTGHVRCLAIIRREVSPPVDSNPRKRSEIHVNAESESRSSVFSCAKEQPVNNNEKKTNKKVFIKSVTLLLDVGPGSGGPYGRTNSEERKLGRLACSCFRCAVSALTPECDSRYQLCRARTRPTYRSSDFRPTNRCCGR